MLSKERTEMIINNSSDWQFIIKSAKNVNTIKINSNLHLKTISPTQVVLLIPGIWHCWPLSRLSSQRPLKTCWCCWLSLPLAIFTSFFLSLFTFFYLLGCKLCDWICFSSCSSAQTCCCWWWCRCWWWWGGGRGRLNVSYFCELFTLRELRIENAKQTTLKINVRYKILCVAKWLLRNQTHSRNLFTRLHIYMNISTYIQIIRRCCSHGLVIWF